MSSNTLIATPTSALTVTPHALGGEAESIAAAMLDYALGWYEGDPSRMTRALHPALAKRATLPTDTGTLTLSEYPAGALIARVARNKPEDFLTAPLARKVTIFAVHGNTATGLLEMDGWTDFMHLVKVDGEWKIINILWEPLAD